MKNLLRNGAASLALLAGIAGANPASAFMGVADRVMTAGATVSPYVGLADITPGMTHYWGLRAASSATRGQNAIQLTGPAGAWTENEATDPVTGDLVLGVNGATCNTTTVICIVSLVYDPIGGFTESGVSSGNVSGNFVPICTTHSKPCIRSTANAMYGTASTITYTQPFSHVAYARRSSGTGFQNINSSPTLSGQLGLTFNNAANQYIIFAGTITSPVAETDGVFHAFTGTFNSSSSIASVDGTSTTGLNAGTGAGTTTMCLFRLGCNGAVPGQALNGDITEFGTYPTTGITTGNNTAIAANMAAWW